MSINLNQAVFTSTPVLERQLPVIYVAHDNILFYHRVFDFKVLHIHRRLFDPSLFKILSKTFINSQATIEFNYTLLF